MTDLADLRARLVGAARGVAASSLYAAHAANRFMGVVGTDRYTSLLRLSEDSDPLVDLEPIRSARRLIAENRISLRYPNKVMALNRIYGIKRALFRSSSDDLTTPSIEHGLFLGDYVYPGDTVYTAAPAVATLSRFRRETIHGFQSLPVFAVGPYIHYAEPSYSREEMGRLKSELGRTLLVFPTHTTEDRGSRINVSFEERFGWIRDRARMFESVIVSVFWWDIESDVVRRLEAEGYWVVTCGMTHDRNFLSRLKTLFSLADAAIGDGIGTHIAYSLSEGTPFTLVASKVQRVNSGSSPGIRGRDGLDASIRHARMDVTRALELDSDDPMRFETLNYYFGLDEKRSDVEVSSILQISRMIARTSRGWSAHYGRAARAVLAKLEEVDPVGHRLLTNALPTTARKSRRSSQSRA